MVHGYEFTFSSLKAIFSVLKVNQNNSSHFFWLISNFLIFLVIVSGIILVIREIQRSETLKTGAGPWLIIGLVITLPSNLNEIFEWVEDARKTGRSISIAYHGNVVNLWKYVVENNIKVDLASDQTSCHAVYEGGYTPYQITFKEGRELIKTNIERFKQLIDDSLREQFRLIKIMKERGTHFWDYGNSFMKAVFDAGVDEIAKNGIDPSEGFIFPSYVEDIMGPICFDFGYGPFRWVCLSGKEEI